MEWRVECLSGRYYTFSDCCVACRKLFSALKKCHFGLQAVCKAEPASIFLISIVYWTPCCLPLLPLTAGVNIGHMLTVDKHRDNTHVGRLRLLPLLRPKYWPYFSECRAAAHVNSDSNSHMLHTWLNVGSLCIVSVLRRGRGGSGSQDS